MKCVRFEVGQKCLWCAQSSDPCRRLPPVYPPRIHLSCISQLPFTPDKHCAQCASCCWQVSLKESSEIELIWGAVLKTNDLPRAEWAGLLTMAEWLPPARNLTNRGVRTQILDWSDNRSDFITIRVLIIPSIWQKLTFLQSKKVTSYPFSPPIISIWQSSALARYPFKSSMGLWEGEKSGTCFRIIICYRLSAGPSRNPLPYPDFFLLFSRVSPPKRWKIWNF